MTDYPLERQIAAVKWARDRARTYDRSCALNAALESLRELQAARMTAAEALTKRIEAEARISADRVGAALDRARQP